MKFLIPTLILLLTTPAFSQTGPGGIRTSAENRFWYDANELSGVDNTPVSSWVNKGGNPLTAFQTTASLQPLLRTAGSAAINGFPVVRFDGIDDMLTISNTTDLNYSTALSQLSLTFVIRTGSDVTSRQVIYEQGGTYRGLNIYIANGRVFISGWNNTDNTQPDAPWGHFSGSASISPNGVHIITYIFNGNALGTGTISGYHDGASFMNVNNVGRLYKHGEIGIGLQNGTSKYEAPTGAQSGQIFPFKGDIAEIVIFNIALSEAERIIVENYLSGKYDEIILNGFYTHGAVHKNNIIGIGQATNGSNHTNSIGDILTVSNPTNLGNNEFFIIGNDDGGLVSSQNVIPEYAQRLERTWRVGEQGEVGNVDLVFDLSSIQSIPASADDIALLVDNDGDFSNATVVATATSLVGGVVTFSGVNVNDDDYITLAGWGSIIWDGASWVNGSGPLNAPNTQDSLRRMFINGPGAVISANANVDVMDVGNGNSLTITSGSELAVNGIIRNNGTITVNSGGGLAQLHDGTDNNLGSGTYIIQRTGTSNDLAYNSWSSPITGAGIFSAFPGANPCDVYVFDGITQSWKYDFPVGFNTSCLGNNVTFNANHVIAGGDGVMDICRGYFIPGSGANTRSFTGKINNGDLSIPIVTTTLGNNPLWDLDDWNLLGNPYPSAINATTFWNENAGNGRISDALYFWDDDHSGGPGYNQNQDYASWNLSGGVSSSNTNIVPNGNISTGQGFWVFAVINTSVIFNNNMRGGGDNTQFFKTEPTSNKSLAWFNAVTPNGDLNRILIGFTPDATNDYDPMYDARKLSGNRAISLGSELNGIPFVIQSQQPLEFDTPRSIGLILRTEVTGVHYFEEAMRENMGPNVEVTIVDDETGKTQLLSDGPFAVYLTGHFTYENRFRLIFNRKLEQTDEDENDNDDVNYPLSTNEIENLLVSVFVYEDQLLIRSQNKTLKNIQLLDINGKQIVNRMLNSTRAEIDINGIAAGVYIVSLETEDGELKVQKLVIP